jgi:hypothetical protein
MCCTAASERRSGQRWEEDDGTTAGPLAGVRTHQWVDALPLSGSSTGPTPARALMDLKAATVVQLVVTTASLSTSGRRGSRVRSGKRRLRIYPHGVWIRSQPAVVVVEISTPR